MFATTRRRLNLTFSISRCLAMLVAALILLGGARPALAHGYIVRAIPEDRSVLEHAPAHVQYWFSEPLEPDFSSLNVRDQTGKSLVTGGVSPDNPSLMTARLPRDLPDGAYIVDMRLAFASDGHVVAESRVFFVGQAVSGVNGSSASTQANPLEVVWRTILLASTLLAFGMFALYSIVLVPAWGNPAYPAGLLPPRVMKTLNWTVILSLVFIGLGSLLALLQQTMAFFNVDAGTVISQNLWQVVHIGTRFGDVWNVRVLLVLLVAMLHGISLYLREAQPEVVRPFWVANTWAMALVVGGFSVTSHAAGSLLWPWVGIAVDWLHTLAVGFWVGGLGALVLVLPSALEPYQGDARRTALLAVLRRFSRLAAACVALVVSTGIYSALNWVNSPGDVTSTSFGGALIIKVLLVAGLLLVGLAHHISLQPERYQRWGRVIERVRGFLPTLRLEVVVALLVIVAASLLSATPVPVPDFAKKSVPAPSAHLNVGELRITMTLSPGGPGVNTYDTLITQAGKPLSGATVRLQMMNPTRGLPGEWKAAEEAEDGLYVAAGDDISQAGSWWGLVDITGRDGKTTRGAFNWDISQDAAVLQSRPPGVLNVLALGGVLLAIGWVLFPWGQRLYRRLDLRPATVAVAGGGVAFTIFFVFLGIYMIQDTQARYQATINPPPSMVNPTLPDEASLERGQTAFTVACGSWDGSAALNGLRERLPRLRDDELYNLVQNGGSNLRACDKALTDSQRWDVVNYVRTLASKS
jgi:copper transport protein